MWNPLKKAKDKVSSSAMGMMQKVAMKKLEKMSPQEREKIMQDAFKPENRNKLMSAMEQMKKAGQITEEQYQVAKNKIGLK